ncbi:MAG: BamA/TamA family outer membrane protein [Methylobacteriaceae bacterium]|nr:BamA/TamA family outer membrane protein [Methylobacteriaceae bacterium]
MRDAGGTAALRYRVDDALSASFGFKGERGRTTDAISAVNYGLFGLPLGVRFDSTDNALGPTTGVRVNATLTPYLGFDGRSFTGRPGAPVVTGGTPDFTRATLAASGYLPVDEDGRVVLAGRIGFGSVFGDPGPLGLIPDDYRFFVGGSGSVRGYRVGTIAPATPVGPLGFRVGGRSELDGSLEARIKVTDAIGIVPFLDAGGAYRGPVPFTKADRATTIGLRSEQGETRYSGGIGAFYVTPIGPIRLDIAAPINPRRGDQPVALYVSIGQAF